MDNILLFIGMMRRANAVAIGADATYDTCRKRQSRLVVLASDAGKRVASGAKSAADGVCPVIAAPYTKEQIGQAFGRAECAVFAVTNSGFAKSLTEKLNAKHRGENGTWS